MRTLQSWFETPLGQMLADVERQALDNYLDRWAGATLLQIGSFGPGQRVLRANTSRQWLAGGQGEPVDCVMRPEQLPFQSGTIDIVVLVHSLDFSSNPHRVLREAERVLAPEGHLLVLGFNLFSLWGAVHVLRPLQRRGAPWNGQYFTQRRVRDWLTLLDLEMVAAEHHFFRPPLNRSRLQERLLPLENWAPRVVPKLGAVHLTVARKHVAGLRPLRPVWRRRPRLIVGGLAQPSSRKLTDATMGRDL
ncbi:MAG: class I SAM-dependent methyltransferase [Xanthomonadaceae bacterium]|nr:class I SAM-dependent methyltransferase [Xanthomonadaceae bacterium]